MYASITTNLTAGSQAARVSWAVLITGQPIIMPIYSTRNGSEMTTGSDTLTPRGGMAHLDTRSCDLDTRKPLATITRLTRLTPDARWLIKLVRDSVARERNPEAALSLARPARHVKAHAALMPAWKGLTNALDTRVSERGASGVRGIIGAATRVSQRDAHVPAETLRPLPASIVVGHAIHPALMGADPASVKARAWLMDTVRREPSRATVRVMMPGPHGMMMSTLAGGRIGSTVRPVSDYVSKSEARKSEARAARKVSQAREVEMVRLASIVGTIGAADTL
jgi:hypothetical protein